MRLFEVKLDKTVHLPEGEVDVGNQVNILREEAECYGQVRTDLDASYRDVNQNYFDQTTLPIDFQETSPEEYFNNFQFPNPDSTTDSGSKNSEDNSNILHESGISSVEGILTAKPGEIVNFLDEERF